MKTYIDSTGKIHEWPERPLTIGNCSHGVSVFDRCAQCDEAAKKPTNPKDAVGIRKIAMSVMPIRVLYEVGLGLLEGALKYGRHNYRVIGVRSSVYYDATKRHLDDYWEGQDTDLASGVHHISKAIASLIVWRDAMLRGNCTDDRPPKSADGWMEELNAKAAALLDKYPNPVPAYTQLGQPASETETPSDVGYAVSGR